MKTIYFTVNNDLNYDQRMIRICSSLAGQGYIICLIGKRSKNSTALLPRPYQQIRIRCRFKKGKFSYLEYHYRLLYFLLFIKADCFCAIDLDTILPVWIASKIKRIPRVYDAHELFTEMKEVITRPAIRKIWTMLEQLTLPHFKNGYTVSDSIAGFYQKKYQVEYSTIRNIPVKTVEPPLLHKDKYILYQGAVNEGRGLEYLIPAMQYVNCPLIICGDGNFMNQSLKLVSHYQLQDKVLFKGMLLPEALKNITLSSYIGVNLVEPAGLNQLYSLANKFFDYIHAAVPQLTMDFPEYSKINGKYKVALLTHTLEPRHLAGLLNILLENTVLYDELQQNCLSAREEYNWQTEEKTLIEFYYQIFSKIG
ncbi:MAG: glycosyltransferase [Chitinophagaceae bacterium]